MRRSRPTSTSPRASTGPAPAVLFYPGHWWPDSKARPDFQAFCINMARLGFVVLSFDPFGQGERGVSSRDHRRTEALLVGVAQQGFAEYETRCALEYLLSRPEVDPRRVGITGASGGGYNTWITAALDDRIAAAVPVVGTSEFAEQIRVCRPLDWYHAAEHCHFVPGLIRYANNHELLAMAAPKPVLIIAASRDQSFPLAGVREVADYGRELYESYGAGEKIGLVVDEAEGHGYQRAKREAAYGWFLRWLMQARRRRPAPGAPDRDRALRLRGAALLPPGPERAGRAGDDRGGAAPGPRPPSLAAPDRPGSGPRPDAVGPAGPRQSRRRPGSSGSWSRRRRGSTSPPSCSGRRARSGACSSPSTTAGRRCWPRTRSSRRPTPGAGRSAAWTPGASANRPPTRPAGCSP